MHPVQWLFYLTVGIFLGGALGSWRHAHAQLVIEICGSAATPGTGACPRFSDGQGGSTGTVGGAADVVSVRNGGAEVINLPVNPSTPLVTPSGWSSPTSPPGTVSPTLNYTTLFTGATKFSSGQAAASAACSAAGRGAGSLCPSLPGGVTFDCQLTTDGSPTCTNGFGQLGGVNVCQAGYTLSGSNCNLSNAAVVVKPADSKPGVKRTGNTWGLDSQDPDTPTGGLSVASGEIRWSDGGNTFTAQLGTDGKITLTSVTANANGTSTQQTARISGAGNGIGVGDYKVEGLATGVVAGAGSLASSSPAEQAACGAPGQPKCAIDETGVPTAGSVTQSGTFGAGKTVLDDATKSVTDKIRAFSSSSDSVSVSWLPSLSGSAGCSSPELGFKVAGQSVPVDLCGAYAPFKLVLEWFLWVSLAVFAWFRITRGAVQG